jgi:hypothetical protein
LKLSSPLITETFLCVVVVEEEEEDKEEEDKEEEDKEEDKSETEKAISSSPSPLIFSRFFLSFFLSSLMNEKKDEMIFVMILKEKKINRKKTPHKEERRDHFLSLSPCFIFYHPPLSSFF